MANLNSLSMIGRICSEPELKTIGSGARLWKSRFVTNNRKKKDGQWIDAAMYIDVYMFGKADGTGTVAFLEKYVFKGSQVYIGGRLQLEEWTDQAGGKRSKHTIELTEVQLIGNKNESQGPDTPATEEKGPVEADVPF